MIANSVCRRAWPGSRRAARRPPVPASRGHLPQDRTAPRWSSSGAHRTSACHFAEEWWKWCPLRWFQSAEKCADRTPSGQALPAPAWNVFPPSGRRRAGPSTRRPDCSVFPGETLGVVVNRAAESRLGPVAVGLEKRPVARSPCSAGDCVGHAGQAQALRRDVQMNLPGPYTSLDPR